MANGFNNAKSRNQHANHRAARRKRIARRLMTWGWIVAAGLPLAHETTAQDNVNSPQTSRMVAPNSPATLVSPVARAIAVGDVGQPGAVAQTAGGLLNQVFGGGSSASKSSASKSSKSEDDGRKAYPLPPPDPSTVNWNGVPYHAPKPGPIAATASDSNQPIRDVRSGTTAARSASTSRSAAVPKPSPGQLSTGQPTTVARTNPTTANPTPAAVPQQPAAAQRPANAQPSVPAERPSTTPVDSPRVASATPLPAASLQAKTQSSEFSTSSSSRRNGRRPIDPLNTEELLTQESASEDKSARTAATYPSVGKREVPAAGPGAVQTEPVGDAASESEAPTVARKSPAPVPPSLAQTPASPAKTPVAPAPPAVEPLAAEPPAVEPLAASSPAALAADASVAAATKPTEPAAVAAPTAVTAPAAVSAPTEMAAAAPEPVSRTAPLSPDPDAKAYPPETIASQLSPLRPVAPETAEPNTTGQTPIIESSAAATDADDNAQWNQSTRDESADSFYGSGVAEPKDLKAESIATPAAPVQPSPAAEPGREVVIGDSLSPAAKKTAFAHKTKVVAASELPGIRVITEGPSEILIRELTQYEVRVENRGSIDATGVVVRTALPPWAEVTGHNASIGTINPLDKASGGQVEWTIDSLPAGVVERLFVRIKAVKPGSFDVATNWTTLPQTHSAMVTVREPKLVVEIEGPDEIIYGKSQKYRVRVLNPGDGVASNVVFTLAPDAADAVEQPIGNIPAGKEASFEIELTARDQGELKIQGAASADLDLSALANKSIVVASAKIDAVLTGPPLKYQGTDAVYQIQITNKGTAISESVEAEVRIPAGVKYIGGIEGARVNGERLQWTIKSLPPGESRDYEFSCNMLQTGNHSLTFNCNGSAAGQASVALETVVEAIADLKLAVIDPPAPAAVGAEVTYEVVVNNHGSKAAENVRIVAQFGHGVEPIRIDGHAGDVVTGQVLFAPIAKIEAGSQVRLKIIAKADRAGDHRFRAEVRSGETVLVAEEATVFVEARSERVSRSSSQSEQR